VTYSFEDARRKAADALRPEWPEDAGTLTVLDYGWEDDTHWQVIAGAAEWLVDRDHNFALMDAPALFVSKATGKVERLPVLANLDRLDRMRPVGTHPA
jgi:hypothetical protein